MNNYTPWKRFITNYIELTDIELDIARYLVNNHKLDIKKISIDCVAPLQAIRKVVRPSMLEINNNPNYSNIKDDFVKYWFNITIWIYNEYKDYCSFEKYKGDMLTYITSVIDEESYILDHSSLDSRKYRKNYIAYLNTLYDDIMRCTNHDILSKCISNIPLEYINVYSSILHEFIFI